MSIISDSAIELCLLPPTWIDDALCPVRLVLECLIFSLRSDAEGLPPLFVYAGLLSPGDD